MTVSSMTGFARVERAAGPWSLIVEAKSVNGRGLDVKTRLPPGREALEPLLRDLARARFKRGSLQINLTLARDAAATAPRIDTAALEALLDAARPYIESGRCAPPRFDGLLLVRGVMVSEAAETAGEGEDALAAALEPAMAEALDQLAEARAREGRALAAALEALLDDIARLTAAARAEAALAPAALAERLKARLEPLLAAIPLDPQRLSQEAALLAARADVREELDRLDAHVAEARALLAQGEAVGRRLDFLAQEFAREANTLSAKASELSLTRLALDLKTAVDQWREQAANVE